MNSVIFKIKLNKITIINILIYIYENANKNNCLQESFDQNVFISLRICTSIMLRACAVFALLLRSRYLARESVCREARG